MPSAFKLKPVSVNQLTELLATTTPRGRTSKGQELIEEFLGSGETAVTVDVGDTKERNALTISASNFVRRAGHKIWVKKAGSSQIALINLAKAPADVKKAYDNRPRVGRQPKKK